MSPIQQKAMNAYSENIGIEQFLIMAQRKLSIKLLSASYFLKGFTSNEGKVPKNVAQRYLNQNRVDGNGKPSIYFTQNNIEKEDNENFYFKPLKSLDITGMLTGEIILALMLIQNMADNTKESAKIIEKINMITYQIGKSVLENKSEILERLSDTLGV